VFEVGCSGSNDREGLQGAPIKTATVSLEMKKLEAPASSLGRAQSIARPEDHFLRAIFHDTQARDSERARVRSQRRATVALNGVKIIARFRLPFF
jgi:hypothetical protein